MEAKGNVFCVSHRQQWNEKNEDEYQDLGPALDTTPFFIEFPLCQPGYDQ
jgi:hypothetical protein